VVDLTASLNVVEGPARGRHIAVPSGELIIGRESTTVDGRLGGDDALSRRHASIRTLDDGNLLVEDLGSRNGTYINDQMLEGRRVVQAGDVLQLGRSVLAVVVVADDTLAWGSHETASASRGAGVVVGGDLRADRGGVAAGRDIYGGVQTVRAEAGGSAAGRDLYHQERYNYDASGWGLVTQTGGFSRALIVIGIIVAFAGFASFGYPIIRAVTEGFSHSNDPNYSGPTFHAVPWLPLGFGLMFLGIVLSTIGMLSIRNRRD
jgi:hypothetical protein